MVESIGFAVYVCVVKKNVALKINNQVSNKNVYAFPHKV